LKIIVFKDEVLNDKIGDEVFGWFEGVIKETQGYNKMLLQ
jgi:hypothetical protein